MGVALLLFVVALAATAPGASLRFERAGQPERVVDAIEHKEWKRTFRPGASAALHPKRDGVPAFDKLPSLDTGGKT